MKNINKIFGIILIALFMLSFVAPISANEIQNAATETGKKAVVEWAIDGGQKILTNVFGLNPIIHGALMGTISAINTFSKLSKVEIDYALDRDKVNISQEDQDYFTPYDTHLTNNKITQEVLFDNMLLTDKNVLDARFINIRNFSEIDNGQNSPTFRLAERTNLVKVFDTNNEPVSVQKREILFEDTKGTIEHQYEYRNFLVKYPISTYTQNVDYELSFSDIFNMNWASIIFVPFTTGANFIKISRFLDGTNKELIKKINDNKSTDIKTEQFRLVFNSYVRDQIEDSLELDMVNCIADNGMILGNTGSEALPHIALDWTFSQSGQVSTISGMQVNTGNWCDADLTGQDNKPYIYCDSTQFTIEVLNKLREIDSFVQANKSSFTCPTPGVTQSLVSQNNNLGITVLNSSYEDRFVNVDYRIEGSFNIPENEPVLADYGELYLTVYKDNVEIEEKIIQLKISDFVDNAYQGEEEFDVGVIFDDETLFKVTAVLRLEEAYRDLDIDSDNFLENIFTPNSEVCDISKNSRNINLYSRNVKLNTSFYEFRSYLMKDGYSDDFKQDFDRYYRFTITAAPTDYLNKYHKYVVSDKFNFLSTFDSEPGRLVLQSPGRYNVLIDVEFDDQWNLFDQTTGNITGKVDIVLSREQAPERDSPLYYMPFNGLVGYDSENARQGYGIDFVGDIVTIDQLSTNQYLRTEPFTQSNTINTVTVKEYGKQPNEFSFLNNGDTRGMLLNINLSATKTNPELYFIPSRATPVGLKVSNQANNAYSFYKLDIGGPQNLGGEPALTSGTLVPWTGIGECLDFSGISVLEAFNGRPDIHAISSRLAPVTPSQTVSYGVEWEERNITRRGNVFLRTIFYTPSNFRTGQGISVLHQEAFDDDAMFYTLNNNGSKTVELNNVFGQDIRYVSEIFSLVKDKQACISYSGSSLKVYYNPVEVYKPFFGGEMASENQNAWVASRGACIVN